MFHEQMEFIRIARMQLAAWEAWAMELVKAIGYYVASVLITTAPFNQVLPRAICLMMFISLLRMMYYRYMRWHLSYEAKMDKSVVFLPVYIGKTAFWLSIGYLLGIFLPSNGSGLTGIFFTYVFLRAGLIMRHLLQPSYAWGGRKIRMKGKYHDFLFTWERFKSTLVYEIIRF